MHERGLKSAFEREMGYAASATWSSIAYQHADYCRRFIMAKDPVCGMDVDEKDAHFKSELEGVKYFFCSASCKKAFDKNPRQYVERGKEGPHHAHK